MNMLKSILLTGFFLLISVFAFSQAVNVNNIKQTESIKDVSSSVSPNVTHTVKTGGTLSSITQKVIELSEGDNTAAEKTVRYLKVDRTPPVIKIVSNEEYLLLETKEQQSVISESEVIKIINQFK